MKMIYLGIVLAPLFGAMLAGFFCRVVSRSVAHWATTLGVATAFGLSLVAFNHLVLEGGAPFNETIYTWMAFDTFRFEVGFLVDRLTVLMMLVVTFVSLMVHIYTIGYMQDDPGYNRFFSYIALFTFAMLMLVMSNNFLQLFFGWEAVGLVSYLLIGFWYTKSTAIFANLKAFLVNRVGDFGFLLGIAAVFMYTGSLDYQEVFAKAPSLVGKTANIWFSSDWSVLTIICICLFIGAMGKSAQVPLHVWLPDSMEGPTPISALIHAATMVTAGVFMVARMSPLFELSETALSFVLVIGSITALFMGFLGVVQNDIKRVVAYSTLSQLGYMVVALGASAYAAGIFHLMTHAFFKALLFLGAGSVIIAMHHEQDIRKMGGLRKYMPITWLTGLAGSLALIGFPGFSGFYSKDAIIEAVHHSQLPGAGFAYFCVLAGVVVTAFYSFRMFFLVFHTKERMDEHTRSHLRETPWVVTLPLVLLAIPSVIIGGITMEPILFGDYFQGAIYVAPGHDTIAPWREHYTGAIAFAIHGLSTLPFWLAMLGLASAAFIYLFNNQWIAEKAQQLLSPLHTLMVNKYGFDEFNQVLFAGGGRGVGHLFSWLGDKILIDGLVVNGSARLVGWVAELVRVIQTGRLYHYAFWMIMGLIAILFPYVFI